MPVRPNSDLVALVAELEERIRRLERRNPQGALVEIGDEGVSQGNASQVDFVGPGVTAAVIGTQATVTIPGGGGGGSGPAIVVP